jgi:hypothetical protein
MGPYLAVDRHSLRRRCSTGGPVTGLIRVARCFTIAFAATAGNAAEGLGGCVHFHRRFQQEKLDLHSLLIVRNGYLVTELYVYPYSAGQVHFIASVAKSVMGALVGIFMLDLPMAVQPGTTFNYCTASIELISAIIQEATGMSAREFANQNLFAPLGIGPISEAQWPSDPQGVTIGGYGLAITLGEMARFGYVFLHQGQWDSNSIVPANWVAASTTSHSNRGELKEYGYLWWVDPQGKWYAAIGRAGQHIFVYPAENLVVVFTSDLPFTNDADLIPLQGLLDQHILPAATSDRPLPANPDALARLTAAIQALAQPEPTAPQALPPIAADISDKTCTLDENAFGWHTIAFSFQDQVDKVTVTVDDQKLAIGLDNVYRTVATVDAMFPQELRGHWENQDTLLVEDIFPGQMLQYTYQVRFSGDSIQITCQEEYSGSQVELQGTLNPAAK